jgi:hypothetical protein
MDRLLQLQSTNALITSLINEHQLEQMLKTSLSSRAADVRRSA